MDHVDTVVRNKLVNPFRMATPSAEWRKVVATLEDQHMSAKNATTFVSLTSANARLKPFLDAWQHLPEVNRQFYLDEINCIKNL